IQMKRVLPWDLISEDEREFIQVSVRPELRRLFASGDFIAKPQSRCANHADLMPAATCRRCGRSYCSQCADNLLRIQPRLCPACNGPCGEPDPRLREDPPWRRPSEILRFPVDQSSWVVTLLLGGLLWIAGSSFVFLPLQLLALPVLVDAVLRSSKGARNWAVLSRLSEIEGGSLLRKTIPIAILSIVLALPFLVIPLVVGTWIGVLLQFPILLFVFFYYPMAVALLLVSDDGERAIHPRTVLLAIWALRDEYFLYLALFIAVAVGIVGVVLVLSFVPFVYRILHSIAVAYGWVLQAHILGFFIYMNRERLRAAA
ncbi:MAG TPA: FYVE zinc finger domain-containing protein, partial [Vicinamibacteria bacterium]